MYRDYYLRTLSLEDLMADLAPCGLVHTDRDGNQILDAAVVYLHDLMDPMPVLGPDMTIQTPGVSHGPHANIRLPASDPRCALIERATFQNTERVHPNSPSVVWA